MPIRNGYQINEPLSSEKEKLALPFLNALKVWSSNSDKVGTIDTLFSAMKESMENGALLYCPLNDNMQFMPISKQITGSSDDGSWMPVFTSHDALVRTPKCQYVLMPMKEYFKKVLEFGEIAGVMVNPGSTLQPFPKMMIEMFWNRFPSISSQSNPGRYGGVDLDNYMAAFHPATSNGENKGAFPFGAPNLDSHSEEKRENENILVSIFDDYPNVWRQPNRFRALLMDLLPQDVVFDNENNKKYAKDHYLVDISTMNPSNLLSFYNANCDYHVLDGTVFRGAEEKSLNSGKFTHISTPIYLG